MYTVTISCKLAEPLRALATHTPAADEGWFATYFDTERCKPVIARIRLGPARACSNKLYIGSSGAQYRARDPT
jgi:hypothetical protein